MAQTAHAITNAFADLAKFRTYHQQAGTGVVEDRDLFGQRVPGIECHVNQTGLLDRENTLDRLGRVVEQHSDALPNL